MRRRAYAYISHGCGESTKNLSRASFRRASMHPPTGDLFQAPLFCFRNHDPAENESQHADAGEEPERRTRGAIGFFEVAHQRTQELIGQVS